MPKHKYDDNFLDSEEAMEITKEYRKNGVSVTRMTIHRWCKDFKIGHKIMGVWHIDEEKLRKCLSGEYVYDREKKEDN